MFPIVSSVTKLNAAVYSSYLRPGKQLATYLRRMPLAPVNTQRSFMKLIMSMFIGLLTHVQLPFILNFLVYERTSNLLSYIYLQGVSPITYYTAMHTPSAKHPSTTDVDIKAMDTPTRAAKLSRPQTRHWKQSISDATNHTTASAIQRARLREHLEAADRLAAKRRTLRSSSSKLNSLPDHHTYSNSNSKTNGKSKSNGSAKLGSPPAKQLKKALAGDEENVEPLFELSDDWRIRSGKFEAFCNAPTPALAPSVVLSVPSTCVSCSG